MSQSQAVASHPCDSADDGDSITAEEMKRAEQIAREVVVPSQGGPWDHAVPLTSLEKEKVRILANRLVTPPRDARHDIKNLADILHFAGATSGAEKMGLWDEFRSLARQHPREFIEECDGDLAQQAQEALLEK